MLKNVQALRVLAALAVAFAFAFAFAAIATEKVAAKLGLLNGPMLLAALAAALAAMIAAGLALYRLVELPLQRAGRCLLS